MRTGSSMDYNQMLVVSVFLHLLVLTIIMFLPKQKIQQKITVPAFNIDVVDIPARRKEMPRGIPKGEAVKPQPEVAPPAEKTEEAIPAPKAEKAPAPKPEKKAAPPAPVKKLEPPKPKATAKIVEALERLDDKPKETVLVKELDRLAKLKSPETYKNLEELKKRKTQPQKPPPVRESKDLEEDESEFDILAKKSVEPKKVNKDKTAAELIKEFQRTAELDTLKTQNLKSETLAKKVDLAMSAGQPFSSSLHRETEAPGTGKTASTDKQADALSLYVGAIKERVYSNWKNPLGAESKEVYVSFFLYSQGNIGKPFVEKSSGNEKLDSLAVRAILDSDPFPAFPPELKEPSLHMTIRFKYIPQD